MRRQPHRVETHRRSALSIDVTTGGTVVHRRVFRSRCIRRLVVLGGVLFCGWLISAGPSARADDAAPVLQVTVPTAADVPDAVVRGVAGTGGNPGAGPGRPVPGATGIPVLAHVPAPARLSASPRDFPARAAAPAKAARVKVPVRVAVAGKVRPVGKAARSTAAGERHPATETSPSAPDRRGAGDVEAATTAVATGTGPVPCPVGIASPVDLQAGPPVDLAGTAFTGAAASATAADLTGIAPQPPGTAHGATPGTPRTQTGPFATCPRALRRLTLPTAPPQTLTARVVALRPPVGDLAGRVTETAVRLPPLGDEVMEPVVAIAGPLNDLGVTVAGIIGTASGMVLPSRVPSESHPTGTPVVNGSRYGDGCSSASWRVVRSAATVPPQSRRPGTAAGGLPVTRGRELRRGASSCRRAGPEAPCFPLSIGTSQASPTSSQGGGAGDVARFWEVRVTNVLPPLRATGPPSVRAIADEPGFSPD